MSDIFQLARPKKGAAQAEQDPFARHGLMGNPFPEPGLDRGVLYSGHMEEELKRIDEWLDRIQRTENGDSVVPLAIRGAIGVGKTHLVKSIQDGLQTRQDNTFVSRKALTDESMKNLLLATLLLHSLPPGDERIRPAEESSTVPLLDRLVMAERLQDRQKSIKDALEGLGTASPIYIPLRRLFEMRGARGESEMRRHLATWLLRGHTTPGQRSKIGVPHALEGEGQAVRAVADLMRIAQAAGLLRVWFVLIDQLEELFRPNVIGAGRRARFLTDLRLLIDLAYEGAPIAVLVAWNTEVHLQSGASEDPLQHEYRALWRRLADPVDLPGLRESDIWPFAESYLEVAQGLPGREAGRQRFIEQLSASTSAVAEKLRRETEAKLGTERFMTARVLHHWRMMAEEVSRRPFAFKSPKL